jgi:outer membrane protein assembly factor BamB
MGLGKLTLVAFAVALTGCNSPAEEAFAYSSDAPSRTGLLPLAEGVILGNEAGALIRLDQEGRERWRVELVRELVARPARVGDTVVAVTSAGEWVGVDLDSGEQRWRLGGKPAVHLPLASDDQRAFAVADDGSVEAISGRSGGTAWKRLPPEGLDGRAELAAPPVWLGGRLFVGLGPAGMYALDPLDGARLWHRAIGDVLGFLAEGERVYALTREGELFALRASDGQPEWSRPLGVKVQSGPWLARGLLWIGLQDEDVLLAVDPQNGAEVWRVSLPAPLRGGVGEYRELVLVPTNGREGQLLGFRPGQSAPVLDLRADSPLRTPPVVLDERALVLAADGRVLAWDILRTSR